MGTRLAQRFPLGSHAGYSRANPGPERLHRSFLVGYHGGSGLRAFPPKLVRAAPYKMRLGRVGFPILHLPSAALALFETLVTSCGMVVFAGDGLRSVGGARIRFPHPRAHALSFSPSSAIYGPGLFGTVYPARLLAFIHERLGRGFLRTSLVRSSRKFAPLPRLFASCARYHAQA